MIKYFDEESGDEIFEQDIKQRLSAPSEGENGRVTITSYKDVSLLDSGLLSSVGVTKIDYIETPEPVAQAWQTVVKGPLDKSVPGEWRETWIVTTKSVSDVVEQRKAEIERERDAKLDASDATVTLGNGAVFQTDPRSLATLNRAKSNADLNGYSTGKIWRDADNVNHPRTEALFAEISEKEEQRQEQIWFTSWTLKESIKAIVDDTERTDEQKAADIMAVQWPAPVE